MIHLQNITVGYRSRPVLRDISVTFGDGELVALLGRNGSGKSTLIRTMAGLLKPLSGKILVDGRDMATMSRSEIARRISLSGTAGIRVPNLKCQDAVAMGRAPWTDWAGRLRPEDEKIVDRAMSLVGMSDYAGRHTTRISDGEAQKIMIARALAQDTPVMLFDEPTAFLDVPGRHQVVDILAKLAAEEGKTILFSTHDVSIALKRASRILLVDPSGIFSGEASDPSTASAIERVFGL